MNTWIDIKDDRSERVKYNTTDFPVYIRKGALSAYPNYMAVSHWHDDVEFIAVLSGHMVYSVNGETVHLNEGNGIFVNARQLHYGFSNDRSECIFICVLLHPVLLCSSHYLEQKFITPVLLDNRLSYHILRHNVVWEQSILTSIHKMHACLSENTAELKIQSLFYNIWQELYNHKQQPDRLPAIRNHHLSSLKDMIAYIQEFYKNKINLSDIAKAGSVGKTGSCVIFRKYTNLTPNAYLVDYRLHKGAELLVSSDMTVAEICYEVGFSGASYFTESFHKRFECSPSEYRRRLSIN